MASADDFINRWSGSGGRERPNAIPFLSELCEVLDVEKPKPAVASSVNDDYCFERPIKSYNFGEPKQHYVDMYKKGCFIIETKQGVDKKNVLAGKKSTDLTSIQNQPARVGHGIREKPQYDQAMRKARGQADGYARAIASEDGWVPFIIVCDIGYRLDIYADFSGKGHHYMQFPDPENFRIHLEDLKKPKIMERLRTIWTDPHSLNHELRQTNVTKDIAKQLAVLGQSLQKQGHAPKEVADFIMRFVFSMFAEGVGLIPDTKFSKSLIDMKKHSEYVHLILNEIWQAMNTGEFSVAFHRKMKKFNGNLFKDTKALQLNEKQMDLLINASQFSWEDVEPAIFGTLLERALDKDERGMLGAHYTPRAYVEQLVIPTVIDPLRLNWVAVQAIINQHMKQGNTKKALKEVQKFYEKLCETRVLDPACGSGNFLYVTFEHMKKLEGEVTALLEELGDPRKKLGLAGQVVSPNQFLGIEKNPWAASVAELVLWIGYLQQHYRMYENVAPAEPVLRDFHNIEQRDAILEWDEKIPIETQQLKKSSRTKQLHANSEQTITEKTSELEEHAGDFRYINPKPAKWPDADFIVGNPPFIGGKVRRAKLGSEYSDALFDAYRHISKNKDFVMHWWDICAQKVSTREVKRFGLITTDSIKQPQNLQIVKKHLDDKKCPVSLHFAIADHPWVDDTEAAKVRIAMTVGVAGMSKGRLATIAGDETDQSLETNGQKLHLTSESGRIHADLTIGVDSTDSKVLLANIGISARGLLVSGKGFKITKETAIELGLNSVDGLDSYINSCVTGHDLVRPGNNLHLINLIRLSKDEVRTKFPAVYQHLHDTTRLERKKSRSKFLRENWWLIESPRKHFQPALENLDRHIVTLETGKHRYFQFLPTSIWSDHSTVKIASDDAAHLAILSSRFHVAWAYVKRGQRGSRLRYNKTESFDTFPFPELTPEIADELRELGEQLDLHRKTQLDSFSKLTMTDMYNVREKYRAQEKLTKSEKTIYNWGIVSLLDDIHNKIDEAVARAYGWSNSLSENEIVSNLVQLNQQRKSEEMQGNIGWIRPDYQIPNFSEKTQVANRVKQNKVTPIENYKRVWPKNKEERLITLMTALFELEEATPEILAKQFEKVRVDTVKKLLSMLNDIGAVVSSEIGVYKSNHNA